MALHASSEDYLEAILVLHKKMGMVRSVDVARHMEVSKPSVCHALWMSPGTWKCPSQACAMRWRPCGKGAS